MCNTAKIVTYQLMLHSRFAYWSFAPVTMHRWLMQHKHVNDGCTEHCDVTGFHCANTDFFFVKDFLSLYFLSVVDGFILHNFGNIIAENDYEHFML
jgi:hypothetical protein